MNRFEQHYPSLNDSRIEQYYDCEKFNNSIIGNGVNDFSVLHVNIRSLNANGESVVHLSSFNCEFDVCLTETWVGKLLLLMTYLTTIAVFIHSDLAEQTRRPSEVAVLT